MARAQRPQAGFSLLELVVAMAIMAMALGVLYRAIGGSARSVGDASRFARAVIVAESVLEMRSAVAAGGWHETGTDQDFRWRVTSAPYETGASLGNLPLFRVQVDVAWTEAQRERVFSLVSLRPQEVAASLAASR